MPASWHIQTPTTPGAIAVVQLLAPDGGSLEAAFDRVGLRPVRPGQVALRDLAGVDRGLVARFDERTAHLMPHGGPAIVRALARALGEAGLPPAHEPDPRAVYPEAANELEARLLAALARTASPLAIDLLLDQPRRWADADPDAPRSAEEAAHDRRLNRLIDPPLVVAIGAPNIGKSSLANALAGRAVALVADEPGTTRDHIGLTLDLAGLVVRYVDTPGLRPATDGAEEGADAIEAEAAAIALQVASTADLLLLCGDASAPPPAPPLAGAIVLRVALRTDLGRPSWPADAAVSVWHDQGLGDLARLIRDTLVPPAVLTDPRPWRFW